MKTLPKTPLRWGFLEAPHLALRRNIMQLLGLDVGTVGDRSRTFYWFVYSVSVTVFFFYCFLFTGLFILFLLSVCF